MKLVFPELSAPIEISENKAAALVIENAALFRRLLEDIEEQRQGSDGFIILSEGEKRLDIAKKTELLSSYTPFDANRKSLVAKLISSLEKIAVEEDFFLRTSELLAEAERLICDISFFLPCEIECERISLSSLLKAFSPHIVAKGHDLAEQLLDYMELVTYLEGEKLFIFAHLRSYLSDEELDAFLETALAHKYHVLLIDAFARRRLSHETRLIIDADLCEI